MTLYLAVAASPARSQDKFRPRVVECCFQVASLDTDQACDADHPSLSLCRLHDAGYPGDLGVDGSGQDLEASADEAGETHIAR